MNIKLGGKEVPIIITKKSRKTISIKLSEKGEVIVSAPLYLSNNKIYELIKTKENWIVSKLESVKNAEKEVVSFKNGIRYLGSIYPVEIAKFQGRRGKAEISFNNEEFNIKVSDTDEKDIREAIINWYLLRCREVFEDRIKHYSQILKVCPKRVAIKDQKTRWGSCSSLGNINLNYRIIMAPMEVVDYLVVHELCHLVHMNHSKDFWNLVESVLPGYDKCRKWLKMNGKSLII